MASFYDRWFDRPSQDIHVDATTLAWIRENEPHRWGMFGSATLRNSRRLRQVGWALTLFSLVQAVVTIWAATRPGRANLPQLVYVLSGLLAGLGIGLGRAFLVGGAFYAFLAMLRGEVEQRTS